MLCAVNSYFLFNKFMIRAHCVQALWKLVNQISTMDWLFHFPTFDPFKLSPFHSKGLWTFMSSGFFFIFDHLFWYFRTNKEIWKRGKEGKHRLISIYWRLFWVHRTKLWHLIFIGKHCVDFKVFFYGFHFDSINISWC